MHIDPALLSVFSALVGALVGGAGSLAAAIYTQRYQDRFQRAAREITKREAVYAEFIMGASKMLMDAYVSDGLSPTGDKQNLIGVTNRMRLFAPPNIIDDAETVIRQLAEISLKPSVDLRKVTVADLSKIRDSDPLLPFSLACRADLDNVYPNIL
jgi:hypothetical protein